MSNNNTLSNTAAIINCQAITTIVIGGVFLLVGLLSGDIFIIVGAGLMILVGIVGIKAKRQRSRSKTKCYVTGLVIMTFYFLLNLVLLLLLPRNTSTTVWTIGIVMDIFISLFFFCSGIFAFRFITILPDAQHPNQGMDSGLLPNSHPPPQNPPNIRYYPVGLPVNPPANPIPPAYIMPNNPILPAGGHVGNPQMPARPQVDVPGGNEEQNPAGMPV